MTKRIQFNTGRKYTAEGQRIVAILHDDNVVTFYDNDRMIAGEFKMEFPDFFGKHHVMAHYDGHSYGMSVRAMSEDHRWQN